MPRARDFAVAIIVARLIGLSLALGLTIDNQLVILANDCYTRVSIGSTIPAGDILASVAAKTISDCEDECSRRRSVCNSFSFGVGLRGNGTCAISGKMPMPEGLTPEPDYDVYIRAQNSPYCAPDRLYKMGGLARPEAANDTRPVSKFGSGLLTILPNAIRPGRPSGNDAVTPTVPLNFTSLRSYVSQNDDERRIADIVRNRNRNPDRNPYAWSDKTIYGERKPPGHRAPDYYDVPTSPGVYEDHGSRLKPLSYDWEGYNYFQQPGTKISSSPIAVRDDFSKLTSPWIPTTGPTGQGHDFGEREPNVFSGIVGVQDGIRKSVHQEFRGYHYSPVTENHWQGNAQTLRYLNEGRPSVSPYARPVEVHGKYWTSPEVRGNYRPGWPYQEAQRYPHPFHHVTRSRSDEVNRNATQGDEFLAKFNFGARQPVFHARGNSTGAPGPFKDAHSTVFPTSDTFKENVDGKFGMKIRDANREFP